MFDAYQPDAAYRLGLLAHQLQGAQPPALRAMVAAAAYDWSRYQRARSAHIRHGTAPPREADVHLARAQVTEAARIVRSLAPGDAERLPIDAEALVTELEEIAVQLVDESWIPEEDWSDD